MGYLFDLATLDKTLHATEFAMAAHSGQLRKGTQTPYIIHPFEVHQILRAMGASNDVCIAGLLHDTIEDCGVDAKSLQMRFGGRIAYLVKAVSENKSLPWKERKQATIDYINDKSADFEVIQLMFADKLANLRNTAIEIESAYATNKDNDEYWNRFNKGYEYQLWYYSELHKAFRETMSRELYMMFDEWYQRAFTEISASLLWTPQ